MSQLTKQQKKNLKKKLRKKRKKMNDSQVDFDDLDSQDRNEEAKVNGINGDY